MSERAVPSSRHKCPICGTRIPRSRKYCSVRCYHAHEREISRWFAYVDALKAARYLNSLEELGVVP